MMVGAMLAACVQPIDAAIDGFSVASTAPVSTRVEHEAHARAFGRHDGKQLRTTPVERLCGSQGSVHSARAGRVRALGSELEMSGRKEWIASCIDEAKVASAPAAEKAPAPAENPAADKPAADKT
jgi:hypothetical protein